MKKLISLTLSTLSLFVIGQLTPPVKRGVGKSPAGPGQSTLQAALPITFHVQQLGVPLQTGLSCGSHTVINAKCFEDILQEKVLPTTEKMMTRFEHYRQHIRPYILEIADMVYGVQKDVDLKELFYLGNINNKVDLAGISAQTPLDERVQAFKAATQDYIFFAVNTPGHWVLIAITKGYGEQPCLFYMNSVSTSLALDESVKPYISYVQSLFK